MPSGRLTGLDARAFILWVNEDAPPGLIGSVRCLSTSCISGSLLPSWELAKPDEPEVPERATRRAIWHNTNGASWRNMSCGTAVARGPGGQGARGPCYDAKGLYPHRTR